MAAQMQDWTNASPHGSLKLAAVVGPATLGEGFTRRREQTLMHCSVATGNAQDSAVLDVPKLSCIIHNPACQQAIA